MKLTAKMKIVIFTVILITLVYLCTCSNSTLKNSSNMEYNVAAYIWPSCHHDERFGDMLWPDGTDVYPCLPGDDRT